MAHDPLLEAAAATAEPMSRDEGRTAAGLVQLRRQLQGEFLTLTCTVCHHVPVHDEVCPTCGGTERMTWQALDALRNDNGPAYVALMAEMSRAVRVAMIRLAEVRVNQAD